jgi:hypothetical protein
MNDDVWQREIARQRKLMWLSGFFAGMAFAAVLIIFFSKVDFGSVAILINNSIII